jgi:hypothetical protein
MADNSSPFRLLWPDIDSAASAKAASRLGVFAAVACCLLAAGAATYALLSPQSAADSASASAYIDAGIFALLAVGIWRMWRAAAIIALLLFLVEQLLAALRTHSLIGFVVPILLTLFFISGVRGTIGFNKFARADLQAHN